MKIKRKSGGAGEMGIGGAESGGGVAAAAWRRQAASKAKM